MTELDRFTEELHKWSLNGKEPSHASRDLRYFLDLQEKRLKDAGVTREEEYTHVKEEISGSIDRKENGYTSKIVYREAKQNITYQKDGKQIKKISRPVTLYVSVVDREGHEDREYVCPTCGHKMTLLEARDGCPYCGAQFETDDVYPCVSYYYTVPGVVERAGLMERLQKEIIIAGVSVGILVAVLSYSVWTDMDLAARIFASLFIGVMCGMFAAFTWYMIRSFLLLFKLFGEAGRAMPLLKTVRSRKKMLNFMKQYDPDFSYEAFEGRVLSLLRTIAFSDKRETLSIWEGNLDLTDLDGVADMQYRGALYIKNCTKEGNMLRVEGTAYLTDTYVRNSVHERDEMIDFVMEKEADAHSDPGFSIHHVSCPSCGSSFDAMHQSKCPYCGKPYDLKKKDWIIKDMSL